MVVWGMAIFWAGIGSPVKRFWRWLVFLLTWATSPATSMDELGFGQSWPLFAQGPSAEAAAPTRTSARPHAHMDMYGSVWTDGRAPAHAAHT